MGPGNHPKRRSKGGRYEQPAVLRARRATRLCNCARQVELTLGSCSCRRPTGDLPPAGRLLVSCGARGTTLGQMAPLAHLLPGVVSC